MNRDFLAWPFFEDRHRDFADRLEAWRAANLPVDRGDVDAACRDLMVRLGRDGWLRPTAASGSETLDVRTLCLARETFARHDGLADFAFAMQGLGTGAPEQRAGWRAAARVMSSPPSP
jgi:acyl-CoA dehydrogenase